MSRAPVVSHGHGHGPNLLELVGRNAARFWTQQQPCQPGGGGQRQDVGTHLAQDFFIERERDSCTERAQTQMEPQEQEQPISAELQLQPRLGVLCNSSQGGKWSKRISRTPGRAAIVFVHPTPGKLIQSRSNVI